MENEIKLKFIEREPDMSVEHYEDFQNITSEYTFFEEIENDLGKVLIREHYKVWNDLLINYSEVLGTEEEIDALYEAQEEDEDCDDDCKCRD